MNDNQPDNQTPQQPQNQPAGTSPKDNSPLVPTGQGQEGEKTIPHIASPDAPPASPPPTPKPEKEPEGAEPLKQPGSPLQATAEEQVSKTQEQAPVGLPPPPITLEKKSGEEGPGVTAEDVDKGIPPVIPPPPKRNLKPLIVSLAVLILLLVSIPAGIVLLRQPQEIRERAATPVSQCQDIKIYDEDFNQISTEEVRASETVFFAVSGTTTGPSGISKARFRVNSGEWIETTQRRTEGEFYLEYQIPPTGGGIFVEAMVFNLSTGWR